ncbi:pyridoxamine 5'-phosphate oxidase family protein [Clostridium sp. UBA4548]|uniref:pyridoxamine 5'-phosphate oxidase family protein n=1 Tax=Clostridium sp. UBA4548 TaxID=1946361 RepID=UPI0025BBF2FE|nr:pyridoxamine 5'-phosphate oxidase family protein [Clostridium sp. UBA4548]
MFREMRRSDKAISETEAIDLLTKGEYGILSTVGDNGYSYGVPLSYGYKNGNLYFHGATEGAKLENLAYSNKVSFTVVGPTKVLPSAFSTNYESVIVFGTAEFLQGEEKIEGLKVILEKYSPEFMDSGVKYINNDENKTKVFKVKIEKITGKAGRR